MLLEVGYNIGQANPQEVLSKVTINWTVGLVRFWWDFLGLPLWDLGHRPAIIQTKLGKASILINEQDLEKIRIFPSLSKEEIAKHLLQKPHDDLNLL